MTRRPARRRWAFGLALLAVLALSQWWWGWRQSQPKPGPVTVPVPVATAAPSAVPKPTIVTWPAGPKLAVVIDDWGYQSKPVKSLATLGFPMTVAVLPSLPYSVTAADTAHAAGHEVILHCPMEAQGSFPEEKVTLQAGMASDRARAQLEGFWASVPHLQGLNNHEGSKATEDAALMGDVAEFLAEKDAYFLDSATTAKSTIPAAAKVAGVPWAKRRIFLDNDDDSDLIKTQLLKAVEMARKRGSCIAIGHPRAKTLEVLRAEAPALQAQGIVFVPVSALLNR